MDKTHIVEFIWLKFHLTLLHNRRQWYLRSEMKFIGFTIIFIWWYVENPACNWCLLVSFTASWLAGAHISALICAARKKGIKPVSTVVVTTTYAATAHPSLLPFQRSFDALTSLMWLAVSLTGVKTHLNSAAQQTCEPWTPESDVSAHFRVN